MSLTDRILNPDRIDAFYRDHVARTNPDRRTDEVQPIVERRNGDERREPRWVQRMRTGELAPKDLTGKAA